MFKPIKVPYKGKPQTCYHAHFDGGAALHRAVKDFDEGYTRHGSVPTNWSGGTWKYAVRAALLGDKALLDQINDADFDFSGFEAEVKRKVYEFEGPRVHVARALQGQPRSAVRKRKVRDAEVPVNICHNVALSAKVDPKAVAARGAAIMEVVERLSVNRPVNLYIFYGNNMKRDAHFVTVKIDCRTMNRQQLAFYLVSPALQRQLLFKLIDHYGVGKTIAPFIPPAFNDGRPEVTKVTEQFWREWFSVYGSVSIQSPGGYRFNTDQHAAREWIKQTIEQHRA